MSTKFMILFQNAVEWDKEPDWCIGISLGEKFDIITYKDEPLFSHYVLPLDQYQKILTIAGLMSFETSNGKTPYYNLKQVHLDSILDLVNEFKEQQ